MKDDLTDLSSKSLLALYRRVMDELRTREITRSSNNPVADYSEFLFCLAFGWSREGNSKAGFDARDGDVRYQIKGRRPTKRNTSRQLSAIRKMEGKPFDFLAGVIFDEDFGVFRAALVPLSIVGERARKSSHVNGWLFNLDDAVWQLPGVTDVTEHLRNAQSHAKHG
ncbi:MAG: hypothetical protein ACREHE_07135 [Rhizomicrobium sp.]